MSAGDIDFILSLWAASLAPHNDKAPFSTATQMYNTIDETPLGDVLGNHLHYNLMELDQ